MMSSMSTNNNGQVTVTSGKTMTTNSVNNNNNNNNNRHNHRSTNRVVDDENKPRIKLYSNLDEEDDYEDEYYDYGDDVRVVEENDDELEEEEDEEENNYDSKRDNSYGDDEEDEDEEQELDEDDDYEQPKSSHLNLIGAEDTDFLNRFDSEHDEREFERIFARIAQTKFNITNNNTEKLHQKEHDEKSSSSSSTLSSSEINSNNNQKNREEETAAASARKLATIRTSLKYLYKLLKYHRLEHYMYELIENGMYTPMSLSQLSLTKTSGGGVGGSAVDLDRLGVASVYDRKKFAQLKQFVRNVVATVNRSRSVAAMTTSASSRNVVVSSQNGGNTDEMIMKSLMNTKPIVTPRETVTNSKKQQLFKKNPNLGNGARNAGGAKKFATATKSSTTSAATNSNGPVYSAKKPTSNGAANSNKAQLQRARSSEPLDIIRKKGAQFSLVPSKSTISIAAASASSVNHPKQAESSRSAYASKFFGPKLGSASTQGQQPRQVVRKIDSQAYDYGVPQTQQQQRHEALSKRLSTGSLLDKKQQKYLEKIGRNLYQNATTATTNSSSQKVTADIYVFARKRPKLECEANFNDVISVDQTTSSGSICIHECKSSVDGTAILRKNDFTFDKTFDSALTNESIFKSSILPFIDLDSSSENRVDFTCICFGQTGSGKTHTLFGNKQQEGFCSLTAQYLFSKNQRLLCGFYEIYNGQLYDLLNKNNRLVLREDSNGHLNVVGLIELEVKSLSQLRKTIEQAQQNRHIGTTSFNKASSRSHAIIQFKVLDATSTTSDTQSATTSNSRSSNGKLIQSSSVYTMNSASRPSTTSTSNFASVKSPTKKPFRVMFIDLAGSERGIDAQNNLYDNRKEGAEINQSLLALKECIRCIDQFYSHAPFRQSKLTRVLRDCFIGKGRTVLMATVSPTDDCVSCSLNTLQYANRVRQMTLRNKRKSAPAMTMTTTASTSDMMTRFESHSNQHFTNNNKNNANSNNNNNLYESSKSIYSSNNNINNNDYRNSLYSTVRIAPSKTTTTATSQVNIGPSALSKQMSNEAASKERSSTKLYHHHNGQKQVEDALNRATIVRSQTNNLATARKLSNTKSSANLLVSNSNGNSNGITNRLFNAPQQQQQPQNSDHNNNANTANNNSNQYSSKVNRAATLTSGETGEAARKRANLFEFLVSSPSLTSSRSTPSQAASSNQPLPPSTQPPPLPQAVSTSASIFHPSKINMSSTPIKNNTAPLFEAKTNSISTTGANRLETLDHDTPIKGHKIKYLNNTAAATAGTKRATHEQLLNQLAEQQQQQQHLLHHQHFARVTVPDNRNQPSSSLRVQVNSKPTTTTMTNKMSRDDYESSSGVESQHSQQSQQDENNKPTAAVTTTYTNTNTQQANRQNSSYSLLNDESLNRLRQKQREMLLARKLLAATSSYRINNNSTNNVELDSSPINNSGGSNILIDQLNITSSARSLNDADGFFSTSNVSRHSQSIENVITTQNKQQPPQEPTKPTTANLNHNSSALNPNSTANANSSFTQFRSVINSQKQLRVYIENLEAKLNNLKNEMNGSTNDEQRKKSTSNESLDSIKEMSSSNANTDGNKRRAEESVEEEDEKALLKRMQSSDNDEAETNLNECLDKSIHKGNLTDLYFSKLRAGATTSENFSPIETRKKSAEDLELTLTPRRQQQLLNPKPIKLSPTCSSSTDSSLSASRHLTLKLDGSGDDSPNNCSLSSSARLISSTSSRIWNKVQPTVSNQITSAANGSKWSSILMRVEDSGVAMSSSSSGDSKMIVSTVPVTYEPSSQVNNKSTPPKVIPKDLLMAHEHQLSDITETCKKEADLLDCLRGSKLEFDEYLKQVDEMLSRKVSSIKDLQSQITRLRSYPAANELITEIDVKQSTTATAAINS